MELLFGAIVLWIVPIFLAAAMGKPKNRAGLAYGLFLGWIGVICLALLPPAKPRSEMRSFRLDR
jgi:hypothetical protein